MATKRSVDPLEYELQEARAMALGAAGKRVEQALAALADGESEARLDAAGDAVWQYLIVRESLAFYDHAIALAAYGVPGKVLARVGVYRKPQ